MVNPKDPGVIPRAPCTQNIVVTSHQLMLFHGSPSPLNAIAFLNVIFFSFETELKKSFIIHYLCPGRKLPLEVGW